MFMDKTTIEDTIRQLKAGDNVIIVCESKISKNNEQLYDFMECRIRFKTAKIMFVSFLEFPCRKIEIDSICYIKKIKKLSRKAKYKKTRYK